jgi:hypothetical protein
MKPFSTLIILACLAATIGCQEPLGSPDPSRKFAGMSRRQLVDQMFGSKDPDMRRGAIAEIASHDWGRQHPYPMGFARLAKNDPEPVVRRAAITALGQAGDARYINEVVGGLREANPGVRWDAAVALDNIIGPEAVEPLFTAALSDTEVDVRSAAAFALRHYRERAVLNALVRCLKDPDYAVRFKASAALTELTGEYGGTDADTWQQLIDRKPQPFAKASQQRPWWDWFGTAQKQPAAPAAKPTAPTPASAGSSSAGQATAAGPAAAPSASGGTEPKAERPWWDWFGTTEKKPVSPTANTTAGTSAGVAGTPGVGSAAVAGSSPTSQPAATPAAAGGTEAKPERPWWDWLGTTEKKNEGSVSVPPAATSVPAGEVSAVPTPATAPTPSPDPPPEPRMGKPDIAKPPATTRPWWDWMGVTEKK